MARSSSSVRPPVGLLALLLLLAACGDRGDGGGARAEEQQERERKAQQLLFKAQAAPVPEKIDFLHALIGSYPETRFAPDARLWLVLYLLDHAVDRPDEALEAAGRFAHHHPADRRVSEAFRMVVRYWHRQKDPEREAAALDAWRTFLEDARGRDDLDTDTKAALWLESAFATKWRLADPPGGGDAGPTEAEEREALAAAVEFLEEASAWEPEERSVKLQVLYRLGSAQARLGRTDDARASFEQALALARAGVRPGPKPELIREQIAALE